MKLKSPKFALLTLGMMMPSLLASSITMPDPTKEDNSSTATDIPVTRRSTTNPGGRPKAPSRQSIDCYYFDDYIYVNFLLSEGECNMTVTDNTTGLSLQYSFTTEEPAEIYVGTLSSAVLEFQTEAGNIYEGYLEK